jgi:hypothetical protein
VNITLLFLQLMIWDLRKGSNTSGVMHFGGTGLYHHPVVACQDIGGAVMAAIHTALEPITLSKQQQETAMDTQLKRSCPPVDHILLDPQHPMRVAMILQVVIVCTFMRAHQSCWQPFKLM